MNSQTPIITSHDSLRSQLTWTSSICAGSTAACWRASDDAPISGDSRSLGGNGSDVESNKPTLIDTRLHARSRVWRHY